MQIFEIKNRTDLFVPHHGTTKPKQCFVWVDCYYRTMGVGVSEGEQMCVRQQHLMLYNIPCLVNTVANKLLKEIAPYADIICDGYTTTDFNFSVTDEARNASSAIENLVNEALFEDTDIIKAWYSSEWFDKDDYPHFSDHYGITRNTTDSELQALVPLVKKEHTWDGVDIEENVNCDVLLNIFECLKAMRKELSRTIDLSSLVGLKDLRVKIDSMKEYHVMFYNGEYCKVDPDNSDVTVLDMETISKGTFDDSRSIITADNTTYEFNCRIQVAFEYNGG